MRQTTPETNIASITVQQTQHHHSTHHAAACTSPQLQHSPKPNLPKSGTSVTLEHELTGGLIGLMHLLVLVLNAAGLDMSQGQLYLKSPAVTTQQQQHNQCRLGDRQVQQKAPTSREEAPRWVGSSVGAHWVDSTTIIFVCQRVKVA